MRDASGALVFYVGVALATAGVPARAAIPPSPSPSAPQATAVPTAAASAPGALPDDTAAAARARDWLGRLQRGDLDRAQLTDDLSRGLGDGAVAALVRLLAPLGAPKRFVLERRNVGDTTADWVYRVSWPSVAYAYTFGIDRASGKIDELYVTPGDAS